jgi:uncharacterized membrane protein
MKIEQFVGTVGAYFDLAGALVMLGGALLCLALAMRERAAGGQTVYRDLRFRLGKAIILALEVLVAADILRTMAEIPSLGEVAVLGLVVLIRTFLSFTLKLELEHRWPWQPPPGTPQPSGGPSERVPGRAGAVATAST